MQSKSFILRSTGAGLIVFLRETHTAQLATRKTTTMTTIAKTWTYEEYLTAVLTQSVAATVAEHDLADGHKLGRNDGLDDWLDQSERTTWDEDLAMKGSRPEEWRGHHQRALAELVDAIESELAEDEDEDKDKDEGDEENAEDAAYSLAQFVEAQAYAAYLASGTGPKAPAAYDAFIAAQAATEAARIVRRDAKLRGAL